MKGGAVSCHAIGTFNASDINDAATYLADVGTACHLPPKILIVPRFTQNMVTNYNRIQPCPQVKIVMNMGGFGFPAKKLNTCQPCIAAQPVQFTGFKVFYTRDVRFLASGRLMRPEELNCICNGFIFSTNRWQQPNNAMITIMKNADDAHGGYK